MGRERTTAPITVAPDGGPPPGRSLTSLLTAVALTIPAIALRFSHAFLANAVEALLVRARDRRRGLHPVVGGRGRAARHLGRVWRSPSSRSSRSCPSTPSTWCSRGRAGTRSSSSEQACKAANDTRGERVLARPRQHDGREPPADRHRLVDGRVHRGVPLAQEPTGPARGAARPSALGRGRVPRARDRVLAHPAPEVADHVVRFGDPRVDLRRVHLADLEGSGRGATPGRSRPVDRDVPGPEATGERDRDVRVRRGRDPALRRALRRGARRDRRAVPHQRVPPDPVARAARLGGARAADRGPVRLAPEHERRLWARWCPRR